MERADRVVTLHDGRVAQGRAEGDKLKRGARVNPSLRPLAAAVPAEEAVSFRGYFKSFSILLMPPARPRVRNAMRRARPLAPSTTG